jgi:ABC-type glutathione transport system ATPase component
MNTIELDPEASRGPPRPSGGVVVSPPHDVADEEPPRDAFHDAAFQQAYSDARTLIGNLSDVLASSRQRHEANSAIRKLCDNAAELARFQCPTTRIVGFVGDSGVGKSSLLNCLLDANQLARTVRA